MPTRWKSISGHRRYPRKIWQRWARSLASIFGVNPACERRNSMSRESSSRIMGRERPVESSSIHSAVTGRERFGESSLRSTATVARISAARNTIEITMMEIMRIIGYSIERISSILRESNRATGTAVLVERGKSPRTGGAVVGVRESRGLGVCRNETQAADCGLDSEQHHSHALHEKVQAMAKKPQF